MLHRGWERSEEAGDGIEGGGEVGGADDQQHDEQDCSPGVSSRSQVASPRRAPGGQASSGDGDASVSATEATSGCPVNTVFRPVPANTSTSNGKMTINKSINLAILPIRLRCQAHTCGLM